MCEENWNRTGRKKRSRERRSVTIEDAAPEDRERKKGRPAKA